MILNIIYIEQQVLKYARSLNIILVQALDIYIQYVIFKEYNVFYINYAKQSVKYRLRVIFETKWKQGNFLISSELTI